MNLRRRVLTAAAVNPQNLTPKNWHRIRELAPEPLRLGVLKHSVSQRLPAFAKYIPEAENASFS